MNIIIMKTFNNILNVNLILRNFLYSQLCEIYNQLIQLPNFIIRY